MRAIQVGKDAHGVVGTSQLRFIETETRTI